MFSGGTQTARLADSLLYWQATCSSVSGDQYSP
eukprot:SAG11_NODE_9880_length_873_cov_0.804910_1_plen_32_part_10